MRRDAGGARVDDSSQPLDAARATLLMHRCGSHDGGARAAPVTSSAGPAMLAVSPSPHAPTTSPR
jgi:hypothetical protein